MTLTGKAINIGETQTFPSGFTKRILVIETAEDYPQEVPIEFVKDKCGLLDKINVGQDVTVSINIRGNEYNGKWYSSIQGWKMDFASASSPQAQTQEIDEDQGIPF